MQGRGQLGFDIKVEEFAVYWPVDDPGRVKPVMAQRGDESLGLPVAEGGVVDQTRPAWRPSGGLGHVGLERPSAGKSIPRIDSFSRLDVDETYGCQHVTQCERQAIDPGDQS